MSPPATRAGPSNRAGNGGDSPDKGLGKNPSTPREDKAGHATVSGPGNEAEECREVTAKRHETSSDGARQNTGDVGHRNQSSGVLFGKSDDFSSGYSASSSSDPADSADGLDADEETFEKDDDPQHFDDLQTRTAIHADESPNIIHLNLLSPQDVTVHMSLPTGDDLEQDLEEFARLRRLGLFAAAFGVFEVRLSHFLDSRYIQLEYGRCLAEAGELAQLARLAEKRLPAPTTPDALELGWSLLIWTANVPVKFSHSHVVTLEAAIVLIRKSWPNLDSTEMYILNSTLSRSYDLVRCFSPADWERLCQHLIESGMIWEFRDLSQRIFCSGRPDPEPWRLASPQHTPEGGNSLDLVLQQWCEGELAAQDESTLFALLDISTMLAFVYMKEQEGEEKVKHCLHVAQRLATELTNRGEANAKTGPYLRWLVAEVLGQDPRSLRARDSISFRGTLYLGYFTHSPTVFPVFAPPIYVPVADEAPEWHPRPTEPTGKVRETISGVLQAAEHNGDLRLKAGCLHELMYYDDDKPERQLEALASLWSHAGDASSPRLALLFRYMMAHTLEARERLRRDILACGRFLSNPTLQYAQYKILRALSLQKEGDRSFELLAEQELKEMSDFGSVVDGLVEATLESPASVDTGNVQSVRAAAPDRAADVDRTLGARFTAVPKPKPTSQEPGQRKPTKQQGPTLPTESHPYHLAYVPDYSDAAMSYLNASYPPNIGLGALGLGFGPAGAGPGPSIPSPHGLFESDFGPFANPLLPSYLSTRAPSYGHPWPYKLPPYPPFIEKSKQSAAQAGSQRDDDEAESSDGADSVDGAPRGPATSISGPTVAASSVAEKPSRKKLDEIRGRNRKGDDGKLSSLEADRSDIFRLAVQNMAKDAEARSR